MAALPTNRNDQIKLLVAIAFVAAMGLYYQFLWAPKSEQLATMQTHVDSLDALNKRAKVEVAKGSLDKLKAQADEYAKEVEIMRQLVPTGNEVPALLEAVSTAARRAGLDISAVSPDGVVNADQFDIYRYKLGVTGPYHQVGEFLTNIGELKRIVAPINVQLQPSTSQSRNQDPTKYLLDATLDIQTYVAHSSPAAAPPAAAAKGGQ